MAITFVSSDSNDATTTITNRVLSLANSQSGDIAFIFGHADEQGTVGTWSVSGATFTLIDESNFTQGRDRVSAVFYRVLDGTEPATVTASYSVSQEHSASIHIFRGNFSTAFALQNWNVIANKNDATPPNATVDTTADNSAVILFNGQTHDDWTANDGAPTGYTLGEKIFGGAFDHRQQAVAYDLDTGTAGTQTPGSWTHSNNNATTSEYTCYSVAFGEDPAVGITDQGDEQLDVGDTGEIVTGFGFGPTQDTAELYLGDDPDFATATKVIQTINTWADTSINFDPVFTGFSDGPLWLFVDIPKAGETSAGYQINFGEQPYNTYVESLSPDHLWRFDNAYTDDINGNDANNTQSGSPSFTTSPIVRGTSHSLLINSGTERTEPSDSQYMNITVNHTKRYLGGWWSIDSVPLVPSAIYEEGGGVNNIYFVIGFGNILLANIADSGTPGFKIQAFSDFKLNTNRAYHMLCKFEGNGGDAEFALYVDGVKQTVTDGNPVPEANHATHSGDIAFGDPDGNLDTGGTDVGYNAATNGLYSHWATWSEFGGGAPLTDAEIRNLFERGCIPENILSPATAASMESTFNTTYDDTNIDDTPCAFSFGNPTDSNDLTITASNVVLNDRISLHGKWYGSGTLTIINSGTSNFDSSLFYNVNGGTVTIIETASITLTVKDIEDNSLLENARVRLLADAGGPLAENDVIFSGLTDVNGEITQEIQYTADQPVKGVVRKSSAPKYYKSQKVSTTIPSVGISTTVFMIGDQ